MKNQQPDDRTAFIATLKNSIWLFGVSSWLFGITDRSIASFADGYLSAIDIMQLFTALVFFAGWMLLKPTAALKTDSPSNES